MTNSSSIIIKNFFQILLKTLLFLVLLVPLSALAINMYVCVTTMDDLASADTLEGTHVDYIVVLGAGIEADGSPSPLLSERLNTAISLYEGGAATEIIISGGHDEAESEVNAMHNYLTDHGIPSAAIVRDNQGDNTFASIKNLSTTYNADSVILVSQKFHLYRACYIAEQMGMTVYGCPATQNYATEFSLLVREYLARIKDFSKFFTDYFPAPFVSIAKTIYAHYIPE